MRPSTNSRNLETSKSHKAITVVVFVFPQSMPLLRRGVRRCEVLVYIKGLSQMRFWLRFVSVLMCFGTCGVTAQTNVQVCRSLDEKVWYEVRGLTGFAEDPNANCDVVRV